MTGASKALRVLQAAFAITDPDPPVVLQHVWVRWVGAPREFSAHVVLFPRPDRAVCCDMPGCSIGAVGRFRQRFYSELTQRLGCVIPPPLRVRICLGAEQTWEFTAPGYSPIDGGEGYWEYGPGFFDAAMGRGCADGEPRWHLGALPSEPQPG